MRQPFDQRDGVAAVGEADRRVSNEPADPPGCGPVEPRVVVRSHQDQDLERVVFDDCRLEEADFYGAVLTSVRFERCSLASATFTAARCESCEIRSCELTALQGVEGLRGAGMTWNDVLQLTSPLAEAVGIAIVE